MAIPFLKLSSNNCINHIALTYGFGEKDIYDYGLNEYIYAKKPGNEIKEENNEVSNEKLIRKKGKLFEDIMYYIGPIQCLIKSKEMFIQIIDLLNDLGNRNEEQWNKYKVEKI